MTRRRAVPALGPATSLLATALLATALLTACGTDEDQGGAAPTPSSTGSASPVGPTDGGGAAPTADEDGGGDTGGGDTDQDGDPDAPPFPADTEPDTADPSGDALLGVTDVRVGRHDGFDRVVLEVDGRGTPGWDVRYVGTAVEQGRGQEIEVEGDAILQVTLTGTGYPADTGVEEYPGPDRIAVAATEAVTEVVFDSTFEGQTVTFVGVDGEAPFRVYLLENPVRVVLEVAGD
jgi:hypothetical protein